MKVTAIIGGIIDVILAGLVVLALLVNPLKSESASGAGLSPDFTANAEEYGSDAQVEGYKSDVTVSVKSSGNSAAADKVSEAADKVEAAADRLEAAAGSTGSSGRRNSGTGNDPYAGFVFPDSDTVLLSSDRIRSTVQDAATCRRAINELYARHGYLFQKQENVDYFNTYSWYRSMAKQSDMTAVARSFNSTEKANVENLQAYENANNWN